MGIESKVRKSLLSKVNRLQSRIKELEEAERDRQRAEQKLQNAHDIYCQAIVNAHGVPYYFNYETEKYDFIGEGCEDMFGIPADEMTLTRLKSIWKEIITLDSINTNDPYEYGMAFRRGEVQTYRVDLKIVTPTGMEKWINDCCVPIRNEETQEVVGTLGIFSDVTERKRQEIQLKSNYDMLQRIIRGTIESIVKIVETRDPYTNGHQQRVALLACAIAEDMRLGQEQIDAIQMSSVVHDIGKINVPSEILSSPRKLTDLEYFILKNHPQVAYDILKSIEFPWPVADIVYQHHERYDGTGYPRGLKGNEIYLEARIISVADVIEAMAYHRPYRPSLSIENALEEIQQQSGVLYDPDVVAACLRLFREKNFSFE